VKEEGNELQMELEEKCAKERKKTRDVVDEMHSMSIKHHKEIAELQMRMHGAQTAREKDVLRLQHFQHDTEEFILRGETEETQAHAQEELLD